MSNEGCSEDRYSEDQWSERVRDVAWTASAYGHR